MKLKRIQNRSKNLTSFVNGELIELPYPTLASGELVDADKLWMHVKTRAFGPLRCFHDIPARMFIPASGEYGGQPIAACGHPQRDASCKYWIMLANVHANRNQLLVREYPLRVPPWPFSSPASSLSVPPALQDAGSASAGPLNVQTPTSPLGGYPLRETHFSSGMKFPAAPVMGSASAPPTRGRISDRMRAKHAQEASSTSVPSTPSATRNKYRKLSIISPISTGVSPPARVRVASPLACKRTTFMALRDVLPSPQVGVAPPDAPVHYSEPVEGVFHTLMQIDDEIGVPLPVFWSMLIGCEVCNRVMTGRRHDEHICDLTYESD